MSNKRVRVGFVRIAFLGLIASSPLLTKAGEPSTKPRPIAPVGLRFEAVDGDPGGRVRAIDLASGREVWAVDVFKADSKSSLWPYRGDAPNLRVREIVMVGGKVGVIGGRSASALLDPATGEIEPVQDRRGDEAAGNCPVHHLALFPGLSSIHYGLAARPLSLPTGSDFPYARSVINAGCCVMPEKRAIVPQCSACLEEQSKAAASKH